MAERKCLMTFYPTDCKDNCFNCKCGGAEATKDMYVSIHDVQRVCAITGGAADTDEGEHIAEVIRNNLENMVMPSADVQPIKHGRWYHNTSKYISELDAYFIQACCSCCGRYSDRVDSYSQLMSNEHCSYCGAREDGDTE